MKPYTKEQFLEWLSEQPDDRPLDMNGGGRLGNPRCECLFSAFLNDKVAPEGVNYICLNGDDLNLNEVFEFSLDDRWDEVKAFTTCGDAKGLKL